MLTAFGFSLSGLFLSQHDAVRKETDEYSIFNFHVRAALLFNAYAVRRPLHLIQFSFINEIMRGKCEKIGNALYQCDR